MITPRKLQEGDIFYGTITRTRAIPRDFVFSKDEYLQVGGYDRSLGLFEDWDLKLKLAKRNDFYYTGIRGTAYRIHRTGLVQSSPRLSRARYLWKVFNRHVGALQWHLRPPARVRMLGIITRSLVRQLLNRIYREG